MANEKSKGTDEAQIRQLIDGFGKAFRAMDINGVMSLYAPGIVSFDILPPLQHVGADAYRKPWKETFALYQSPLEYEIRDLSITIGDDVAFCHSLNRMSGTMKNGQKTDFWLRCGTGLAAVH